MFKHFDLKFAVLCFIEHTETYIKLQMLYICTTNVIDCVQLKLFLYDWDLQ